MKVWISKGEILEHDPMASEKRALESGESGGRRRDQGQQREAGA